MDGKSENPRAGQGESLFCIATSYVEKQFPRLSAHPLLKERLEKEKNGDDNMVMYRAKKRFPFKWIVAAVVFVATLCITFSDLYGACGPF